METFYEEYPDIELDTAGFGSNDEAIAKLLAGFEADVVNSCVDEATLEMVQRGLYQPLDVNRLENWDDIFPSMKELPGVMVDGQPYIVPVDAGTAGIMYDADVVTDVPDSWTDLFDSAVRRACIARGPLGDRDRRRCARERDHRPHLDGRDAAPDGQAVPDRPSRASSGRSGRARPTSSRSSRTARS